VRTAGLLAAATVSLCVLAGCGGGGGDKSDGDDGTEPGAFVSSAPSALNACRTAMIVALTDAYNASQKAPAAERDQVFVEKAGNLPEECKLVDPSELKRLRDEATEIAIP
jgi:hypothetical protein